MRWKTIIQTSLVLAVLTVVALAWMQLRRSGPIVVASKSFTESVVLGEIATHLLRNTGETVRHRAELGGTRVLFSALEHGDIDVYPEYTGTLIREILSEAQITSLEQLESELARRGIHMTQPLGFNNAYAIGMRPETAERLRIRRISDLRAHPTLRLGLSNEFMDREDGWPGLRRRYALPHSAVRGLDHDLAYRALDAGQIDAMELYTTDAEIAYYDLRVLEDDLSFFPRYEAVFLYRSDLDDRAPLASKALRVAEATLDEPQIRAMNASVKLEGRSELSVAADFVGDLVGTRFTVTDAGLADRLWLRTREHLVLVGLALFAGIVVAIPLGIISARFPRPGRAILAVVSIVQTIPALALLVFMIPLLGIYEPPAIAALFLYSLLPMVRNTTTGLQGIPLPVQESAEALGLTSWQRLITIDLPLASPSILAGVKTSAVITVGFATLGALIGAGGYGQPIFTGIRLDDPGLILEGAVPSALLALAVQGAFGVAEPLIVPRGVRLRRNNRS
jgi:osmoprotectant transport system permease protein